jgi:hypothetical protein
MPFAEELLAALGQAYAGRAVPRVKALPRCAMPTCWTWHAGGRKLWRLTARRAALHAPRSASRQ